MGTTKSELVTTYLTRVIQMPSRPASYENAFSNTTNLVSVDLTNAVILSAKNMFDSSTVSSVIGLNITDRCTNMDKVFYKASNITEVGDMSLWDMSGVKTAMYLFSDSGITDFSGVTNWNMSSFENLNYIFNGIKATDIDISGWVHRAKRINDLFAGAIVTRLNVTNLINSHVTHTYQIFWYAQIGELVGTDTWDTSNVVQFDRMFGGAKLEVMNFSNWIVRDNASFGYFFTNPGAMTVHTIYCNNILMDSEKFNSAISSQPNKPVRYIMDEIHPEMTKFKRLFYNSTSTNDISLPKWTTDADEMCTNATSMTHIHSNWNKSYIGDEEVTWQTGDLWVGSGNFGQFREEYSMRVTGFIPHMTDIKIIAPENSRYMKVMAYDADKRPIGYFNMKTRQWVVPATSGIDNDHIMNCLVPYNPSVAYVRIAVQAITLEKLKLTFIHNATDCYKGCTAITHIDGELYPTTEYTKPLDDIPVGWGGYGFERSRTAIIVIETPEDNYTFQSSAYPNDSYTITMTEGSFVDWGDGTSENVAETTGLTPKHTYAKAGRYVIKGNLLITRPGYGAHGPAGNCVVEVQQYPTESTLAGGSPANYAFYNFTKCRYINARGLKGITGSSFRYLSSCETIDVTGATFKHLAGMFWGGSKLKNIIGMTKESHAGFEGDIDRMLEGCYELEDWKWIEDIDTSNVKNMTGVHTGLAKNVQGEHHLDLSKWDVSNVVMTTTAWSGFLYDTGFTTVDMTGWRWNKYNDRTMWGFEYLFANNRLRKIIGMDTWKFNYDTSTGGGYEYSFYRFMENQRLLEELDLSAMEFLTRSTKTSSPYGYLWNLDGLRKIKIPHGYNHPYLYVKSQHLTTENLVEVIDCLGTRDDGTVLQLLLGPTNLAKLSDEQKAVAINKGWTLS